MPNVGDPAPPFSGTDCHGRQVSLEALRGKRVVLFFFPRVFTAGCTLENRYFRDHYQEVRALGAELVGVSVDPAARSCEFAQQEDIHFSLLSDPSREISRAYDVLWPLLNVDKRKTFVIDPNGVIERVLHHEVRIYRHLDDVLAHLRERPPAQLA
jgi:peroxiredoxin Q/BCP